MLDSRCHGLRCGIQGTSVKLNQYYSLLNDMLDEIWLSFHQYLKMLPQKWRQRIQFTKIHQTNVVLFRWQQFQQCYLHDAI